MKVIRWDALILYISPLLLIEGKSHVIILRRMSMKGMAPMHVSNADWLRPIIRRRQFRKEKFRSRNYVINKD